MEHLQIAYDLFVIMIAEGAALSICRRDIL
jgi:hypothetical protein